MAEIKSGTVTVTTAGTRVAFPAAPKKCLWIRVQVVEGNTGVVYFGDSAVSNTSGTTLYQGTDGIHSAVEVPFHVGGGVKLDTLYLDAATNGDKAEFVAVLE